MFKKNFKKLNYKKKMKGLKKICKDIKKSYRRFMSTKLKSIKKVVSGD